MTYTIDHLYNHIASGGNVYEVPAGGYSITPKEQGYQMLPDWYDPTVEEDLIKEFWNTSRRWRGAIKDYSRCET